MSQPKIPFRGFQISAINPKKGTFILEPQVVAATSESDARDQAVLLIGSIEKVRKAEVVVRPL